MSEILVQTDTLTGSNCYILAKEGHALIIDPNDGDRLCTFFKEEKLQPEYVILTHEHCDHMQGLKKVRSAYGALKVIAQKQCSENLENSVKNMSGMMETYLYFKSGGTKQFHYPPIVCPPADVTFEKEFAFFWRGHEFFMESVPGHTQGSIGIWMDRSILFSGDYLILGEEDLTRFPGGSSRDYETFAKPWIQSLPKGLWIYPGHGAAYQK